MLTYCLLFSLVGSDRFAPVIVFFHLSDGTFFLVLLRLPSCTFCRYLLQMYVRPFYHTAWVFRLMSPSSSDRNGCPFKGIGFADDSSMRPLYGCFEKVKTGLLMNNL